MAENSFQPKIVAFVCRWCTYTGADLAGMSRLQYPPNTKVVMLPCSGRIDINFVLRAFMQGADGVLVSITETDDGELIRTFTSADDTPTALPSVNNSRSTSKRIVDGHIVIEKNGILYDLSGNRL